MFSDPQGDKHSVSLSDFPSLPSHSHRTLKREKRERETSASEVFAACAKLMILPLLPSLPRLRKESAECLNPAKVGDKLSQRHNIASTDNSVTVWIPKRVLRTTSEFHAVNTSVLAVTAPNLAGVQRRRASARDVSPPARRGPRSSLFKVT